MDHFYQQKLINEKNELQRQVTKANKQIAQLSEQVKQYETLLASLDEGMIPSQIRLRGGPIDQAGVHERSFATQADAQDRKLTSGEQLALVRHAQNDSKANQRIARSKPQPPKSKELGDNTSLKSKQLGEMRVVDSLMSGGIRSAAKAVASNIRQRGVLGGLGVNPSKGFVNKLRKTKGVPIVTGETGEPVAAGRFSGLGKALSGAPQLSAPERAANRVITGTAEPNVVSGPMGSANVQKVKPDLTVIKKPLNPYYGS